MPNTPPSGTDVVRFQLRRAKVTADRALTQLITKYKPSQEKMNAASLAQALRHVRHDLKLILSSVEVALFASIQLPDLPAPESIHGSLDAVEAVRTKLVEGIGTEVDQGEVSEVAVEISEIVAHHLAEIQARMTALLALEQKLKQAQPDGDGELSVETPSARSATRHALAKGEPSQPRDAKKTVSPTARTAVRKGTSGDPVNLGDSGIDFVPVVEPEKKGPAGAVDLSGIGIDIASTSAQKKPAAKRPR